MTVSEHAEKVCKGGGGGGSGNGGRHMNAAGVWSAPQGETRALRCETHHPSSRPTIFLISNDASVNAEVGSTNCRPAHGLKEPLTVSLRSNEEPPRPAVQQPY